MTLIIRMSRLTESFGVSSEHPRVSSSFKSRRRKSSIGLSLGNGPDAGVGPLGSRTTLETSDCRLAGVLYSGLLRALMMREEEKHRLKRHIQIQYSL